MSNHVPYVTVTFWYSLVVVLLGTVQFEERIYWYAAGGACLIGHSLVRGFVTKFVPTTTNLPKKYAARLVESI